MIFLLKFYPLDMEKTHKRFSVPFKLSVDNQEDVILKSEVPNIKFVFEEFKDAMPIAEEELFKVLSSGELRALYILNIIFEVEARKQNCFVDSDQACGWKVYDKENGSSPYRVGKISIKIS